MGKEILLIKFIVTKDYIRYIYICVVGWTVIVNILKDWLS